MDGHGALSSTDTWMLSVTGTFALNLPGSGGASASWGKSPTSSTGGALRLGQASAIVSQPSNLDLVTYGGCNYTADGSFSGSCANQDGHSLSFSSPALASGQWTNTANCPSPRYGAVLAQNLNNPSSWPAQAFLALGSEPTAWSSSSSLIHGEVGVLDVNAGTWTRVLPSGNASHRYIPHKRWLRCFQC